MRPLESLKNIFGFGTPKKRPPEAGVSQAELWRRRETRKQQLIREQGVHPDDAEKIALREYPVV